MSCENIIIPDNDPLATQESMKQLFEATEAMMAAADAEKIIGQGISEFRPESSLTTEYERSVWPEDVYRIVPQAEKLLGALGLGAHFNEIYCSYEPVQIVDAEYLGAESGYDFGIPGAHFVYPIRRGGMYLKSWFNPNEDEERMGLEYDDHEVRLYVAGSGKIDGSYVRFYESPESETLKSVVYPLTQTRCDILNDFMVALKDHAVPSRESKW